MKPILVSSGEPAGIGPDICLQLAMTDLPVVILGDKKILQERMALLGLSLQWVDYDFNQPFIQQKNTLAVLSLPCPQPVHPGQLQVKNAPYVMELLEKAILYMQEKKFSALVTAPVHKEIINQAGIPFTGHTELLAKRANVKQVVMMLASQALRVALVTTHLPLSKVPFVLNTPLILQVIQLVHHTLQKKFNLAHPLILVAGLNPHAGEGGYLGHEDQEIIAPAVHQAKALGMQVEGPLAADTLFNQPADAYVAMYHDQGLPVIKYASFDDAVNITLGLPFIRTSVDHGTALSLAGSGNANPSSLFAAVKLALQMGVMDE